MSEFRKAANLNEIDTVINVEEPLPWNDARYEDISIGRGGDDLKLLRRRLSRYAEGRKGFAKFAFTGHRGSGKSTELLRIEHDFSDRFTPLHITADPSLYNDYDYTDLFLWLVDELVRKFAEDGTPLEPRYADDVARWFAEVTLNQTDFRESEVTLESGANAEGKLRFFGQSLGIFAKLKSMIKGSSVSRKEIRQKLQNKSTELIGRVNTILSHAQLVLRQHGKPAELLIVVDDLDRLLPDVSRPLFFEHGDLLKQLNAHVIYTVPIASDLAPFNIGNVFEKCTLSMVKVRNKENGKVNKRGIDVLVKTVARRVEIDLVFAKVQDVRKLAEMSGGSVRELMRLILSAQLIALVDDKEAIDAASVKKAVLRMRLDYERALNPGWAYYPRLARIHRTKSDGAEVSKDADPENFRKQCEVFSMLLFNTSVLEYNGDQMWYDVNPIVQETEAFRKALADVQVPPQTEPSA